MISVPSDNVALEPSDKIREDKFRWGCSACIHVFHLSSYLESKTSREIVLQKCDPVPVRKLSEK